MAALVGARLRIESRRKGDSDMYGAEKSPPWQIQIEGACGEIAVAKVLGKFWSPRSGDYQGAPDIQPDIQVRTLSGGDYSLYVRPSDRTDQKFYLVVGTYPWYSVKGWILGADARRDEWWAAAGNRPPAWFVPQQFLHDL